MKQYVLFWIAHEITDLLFCVGVLFILCLLWAIVFYIAEFIGRRWK